MKKVCLNTAWASPAWNNCSFIKKGESWRFISVTPPTEVEASTRSRSRCLSKTRAFPSLNLCWQFPNRLDCSALAVCLPPAVTQLLVPVQAALRRSCLALHNYRQQRKRKSRRRKKGKVPENGKHGPFWLSCSGLLPLATTHCSCPLHHRYQLPCRTPCSQPTGSLLVDDGVHRHRIHFPGEAQRGKAQSV